QVTTVVCRFNARADQNVVPNDDWSHRRKKIQLQVGDFRAPALFPSGSIQRHQIIVWCDQEQPFAEHGYPAVPDVCPAAALILPMPDQAAGPRIECPGSIGNRNIDNALDYKRSRLDWIVSRVKGPNKS